MEKLTGLAIGAVVCLGSACGGGSSKPPAIEARGTEAPALAQLLSKSCAGTGLSLGPTPEPGSRQGSSVALGRSGGHLVAYVADQDRDRLVLVDVTTQRVEGSVSLFGSPEQVVILRDGRVVAAVGSGRHIEVFEPQHDAGPPLRRVCAREVPAGPFGLAVSPDEETLVVTSAWEPALTVFDMSLARKGETKLPRAPRGVIVDARGHAFVTHLVGGQMSVVSLAAPDADPDAIALGVRAGSPVGKDANLRMVRKGSQAYALASFQVGPRHVIRGEDTPGDPVEPQIRLVVPMVSVDPGEADRPTEFYYGPPPVAGVGKAAPLAIIVDPDTRRSLSTHVVATTSGPRAGECQIPRAVAVHPREPRIYVACAGIDELLELDARSADPMHTVRRRIPIPDGPTGVAVAGPEGVAVVYGQFDDELAVVPLDDRPTLTIGLGLERMPSGAFEGSDQPHLSRAAQRGRSLFYRSDDSRITRDGMACSSCHPDGTEDSLSWNTPDGLRQTIMLAGRVAGTAPFGWTRNQRTLDAYVADTCQRLGGSGLDKGDLDDLVEFLTSLPRPPAPRPAHPELVAQGREVFFGRGCVACHRSGTGTDAVRHQLGRLEKEPIDTPSLRDVGRTAPYFHDGRYATLETLLGDPDSRMGATAALSPPERQALRAFLESL